MSEHIKDIVLVFVYTVMFLYMVFAWVIALMLTVAISPWFLLMIPMWIADLLAFNQFTKYINRRCGHSGK